MRWLAVSLALGLALPTALPAAGAERREPSPAQLAQQTRMRDCAAQAKTRELRGPPRREFMKTCLSGRPAAG